MDRLHAVPTRHPPRLSAATVPARHHANETAVTARSSCACGGGCPRCRGEAPLAGSRANKDLAPPVSPLNPLTEQFGRWARYTTVAGPVFNPPGTGLPFFRWSVNMTTSMDVGMIVQKIESTWWAENCDGTPYTGFDPSATYWEGWFVENNHVITPKDKLSGADDRWERGICDQRTFGDPCPTYAAPTRGAWGTRGELYAYPNVDLDFVGRTGGRSPAGNLPHTLTEPAQDLGPPRAVREIGGAWDICDPANPTHTRL
jgi:hypothetical protein